MGLPLLYLVPEDDQSWQKWSFNHAAIHMTVLDNINRTKNQDLAQYQLDPIGDFGFWLYQHSIMHAQVDQVLGLPANDLLSYDLQDPEQLREWLLLNGTEHQAWSQILGV